MNDLILEVGDVGNCCFWVMEKVSGKDSCIYRCNDKKLGLKYGPWINLHKLSSNNWTAWNPKLSQSKVIFHMGNFDCPENAIKGLISLLTSAERVDKKLNTSITLC